LPLVPPIQLLMPTQFVLVTFPTSPNLTTLVLKLPYQLDLDVPNINTWIPQLTLVNCVTTLVDIVLEVLLVNVLSVTTDGITLTDNVSFRTLVVESPNISSETLVSPVVPLELLMITTRFVGVPRDCMP